MSNRRRSVEKEAFWREHLKRQVGSGRSIRVYCREHGLSEPSFYVWRREISRRDLEQDSEARVPDASASDIAGLVAVDVVGQMQSLPLTMEVVLSTGMVIRLREDVSAGTLARVLAAAGAQERAADSDRDAAC